MRYRIKEQISKWINNRNSSLLIYSESMSDMEYAIISICGQSNIKTEIIRRCDCPVINQECNIFDLTAKNPDTLYIINEAHNLYISAEELMNIPNPVILLISNRHFLSEFKKCSDNVLIDTGLEFSDYMRLSDLTLAEQLYLYVITDGEQKYMDLYNKNGNILPAYSGLAFLSEYGALYDKPIKDIYANFHAPEVYVSIMYALANGCGYSGDIALLLNMKQTTVSKYLCELQRLGYIHYVTPITNPKSKRGIYVICSPFYHFWFRFIYKNLYVNHDNLAVTEDLKENRNTFILENYLCEYFKTAIDGKFPNKNIVYGEWWDADYRLDIVGTVEEDNTVYISKYFTETVSYNDYEIMKSAVKKMKAFNNRVIKYIIFSDKGFDDELQELNKYDGNLYLENINLKAEKENDNSLIIPVRRKNK